MCITFPFCILRLLMNANSVLNASHLDFRNTCIQLFFLDPAILVDPAQNFLVPEQGILRFKYPLITCQLAP